MAKLWSALLLAHVALTTVAGFVPTPCVANCVAACRTRNERLVLLASKKAGKKAPASKTKRSTKKGGSGKKPPGEPLSWASSRTAQSTLRENRPPPKDLHRLVATGATGPKKLAALVKASPEVVQSLDEEGYSLLHVACRSGMADAAGGGDDGAVR